MKMHQIATPALLVDLDAMEFNLRWMAESFVGKSAKLRPHFKNHKIPLLAWKQLRAGAIGITCATVREAEILVHHGIDKILIANEIAGETKCEQLAELSRHASVVVAIDNRTGVRDLARAQRIRKTQIEIVVDIDIGLGRCGVKPGEAAVDLARFAVAEGLQCRGVMGYEGHLQAMPQSPDRDDLVCAGDKSLVDSAALIESAGIPVSIISTGGTGTYSVCGNYPGVTEVQAGSYLLMDTIYLNRGASFQRSLTVLTTVISTRGPGHAVVDCGVKAMSGERGLPVVKNIPGVQVKAMHAEHGLIEIEANSAARLEVGQQIELWVHYSDATINLHSSLYGVRHGKIEEVFQIEH